MNDLIVYGYIRYITTKFSINIPIDIYKLILLWCTDEYVHVINRYGTVHLGCNVNDIFENLEPI